MTPRRRKGEEGYSLLALLASLTVMLILMAAATPSWRYVMRNDREEELIFRGGQIADAVSRYQRKNGGGLPLNLEALVKGKFLRKAWKDPTTRDGKWRFIRPGEPIPGLGRPGQTFPPGALGGLTRPPTEGGTGENQGIGWRPGGGLPGSEATGMGAGPSGPFIGVASLSKDKGLRRFNGREKYNEWFFVAGQPRMVGEFPAPGSAPLTGPGGVLPGGGRPGGPPGGPMPPGGNPGRPLGGS